MLSCDYKLDHFDNSAFQEMFEEELRVHRATPSVILCPASSLFHPNWEETQKTKAALASARTERKRVAVVIGGFGLILWTIYRLLS